MNIMNKSFVSIIIPTYNDWERLSLCLQSLSAQTYPQELFEIIVVNNKRGDKSPEKLIKPDNCLLIDETKPGSYAARNAAIKIAKGEILGFTDSDCIPDKNWISNIVEFLEQHKEIKRVGGAINIFFKKSVPSKVELYDEIFAFPQEAYVKSGNAVTANMFTYKSVFHEIGMFNESLMSGGDYQWGMLAHRKGFPIAYAPTAIVNHPARQSVKELVVKAKRVGKGQANFKSPQDRNLIEFTGKIIDLLKPRIWEIKRIFQQGRNLSLSHKLYLVLLRHYVVLRGEYARLRNESQRKESVS